MRDPRGRKYQRESMRLISNCQRLFNDVASVYNCASKSAKWMMMMMAANLILDANPSIQCASSNDFLSYEKKVAKYSFTFIIIVIVDWKTMILENRWNSNLNFLECHRLYYNVM